MRTRFFVLCAVAVVSCASGGAELIEHAPAANWQESSLTGNGTIGAMVEGRIEDEAIHLSHCKLYLPEPGDTPPALVNHPLRPIRTRTIRTSTGTAARRGFSRVSTTDTATRSMSRG